MLLIRPGHADEAAWCDGLEAFDDEARYMMVMAVCEEHRLASWVGDDQRDSVSLITGSSRGLGRKVSEAVLRRGGRVVATAERVEDFRPLVEEHGSPVIPIELNVNDEMADRETVERVVEVHDHIEVVVNNAGFDSGPSDRTE